MSISAASAKGKNSFIILLHYVQLGGKKSIISGIPAIIRLPLLIFLNIPACIDLEMMHFICACFCIDGIFFPLHMAARAAEMSPMQISPHATLKGIFTLLSTASFSRLCFFFVFFYYRFVIPM